MVGGVIVAKCHECKEERERTAKKRGKRREMAKWAKKQYSAKPAWVKLNRIT